MQQNIFTSARFKITSWYIVTILIICLSFSTIIYALVSGQIEKQYRDQIIRYKAYQYGFTIPEEFDLDNLRIYDIPGIKLKYLDEINQECNESISLAKDILKQRLFIANIIIIAISGTAGYFLAGLTLEPIKHVIDDQNRFIADSSHELKTPITALKSSLEVNLANKKLPKSYRHILEENLEEVENLETLTKYLLDLAKFQSQPQLELETINSQEVLNFIQRIFEPVAKKKKIKLTTTKHNQFFEADRQKIQQLISIFVDNAIKYTDNAGKVSLKANSDKKYIYFTIKDNGIGITKEDQQHIFDRFYRADPSRCKTNCDGFGLGLSIADKITKSHHGTISLRSQIDQGSIFTIRLPLKQ